jgi:uncharacterized protein
MSDELEIRRHKVQELRGRTERRAFDGSLELRDVGPGKLGLVGFACLTNVEYEVGNLDRTGFVEVVRPGAFADSLRALSLGNGPDVPLLINHGESGSGCALSRTGAGTLRLTEDARGLKVDADLDEEDPDVRLLQRKFAHGNLDGQMSMAFRVPAGGDKWSEDGKRREISRCDILGGDVSVVTQAASPTTSSELVARMAAEAACRPLPDYSRRHRERLASMRGSSPRPQGVLVTVPAELDPARYRRRLDELRGL